jgi:hypothetical protein
MLSKVFFDDMGSLNLPNESEVMPVDLDLSWILAYSIGSELVFEMTTPSIKNICAKAVLQRNIKNTGTYLNNIFKSECLVKRNSSVLRISI